MCYLDNYFRINVSGISLFQLWLSFSKYLSLISCPNFHPSRIDSDVGYLSEKCGKWWIKREVRVSVFVYSMIIKLIYLIYVSYYTLYLYFYNPRRMTCIELVEWIESWLLIISALLFVWGSFLFLICLRVPSIIGRS